MARNVSRSSKRPAPAAKATKVRNTPVPRASAPAPTVQPLTHSTIARRAYEIWQSGQGAGELADWLRAERELGAGR
jgi:hypothetical protein